MHDKVLISKVLTIFFWKLTFSSYNHSGQSVVYLNHVVKINLTYFRISFLKKNDLCDFVCTHCTLWWCKSNFINCTGISVLPSSITLVVHVPNNVNHASSNKNTRFHILFLFSTEHVILLHMVLLHGTVEGYFYKTFHHILTMEHTAQKYRKWTFTTLGNTSLLHFSQYTYILIRSLVQHNVVQDCVLNIYMNTQS